MQNKKKMIFIILIILGIIGAVYMALNPSSTEVRVYRVEVGSIQQSVNGTGLVQALESEDIYNGETGLVENLPIKIGSTVEAGDVLAVLTNNDLGIQKSGQLSALIQAQQNLALVKSDLEKIKLEYGEAQNNKERTEKLYLAGAVSKSQLEATQINVNKLKINLQAQEESFTQALEQVQITQAALDNLAAKEKGLIISSPMPGTIVSLPVKKGQFLTPGALIAQVANLEQMEIKSEILGDDMADISVGQLVNITSPALKEKVLVGQVTEIYPQAQERLSALGVIQYRVPVIINLPVANELKPGYEVKVSIATLSKENVIIVPREAVIYKEGVGQEVMLINNGRVSYQAIETGIGDKTNIEIIKGLVPEQKIVIEGSNLLKLGTRVKEVLTK